MAFLRSGPLLRRAGGARRAAPRPSAAALWNHFADLGPEALAERQDAADREMRAIGVTFTVYDGDDRGRPALALRHHPPGRSLATSGSSSSPAWSSG